MRKGEIVTGIGVVLMLFGACGMDSVERSGLICSAAMLIGGAFLASVGYMATHKNL